MHFLLDNPNESVYIIDNMTHTTNIENKKGETKMGSHNLGMEIKTTVEKKFKKLFRQQQDSDLAYYGHQDGYNGSWSTINGVRIVSDPFPERKQWTAKKKRDVMGWIYDSTQKWEPAKAVKTSKSYLVGGWAVS